MISTNPDVNVHIDTALAKPGMRRVEKLRKMLDSYYEGNMIDLSEYTEEIEELMDAYIDSIGQLEDKKELTVVLTSVEADDEAKGFYFGMKYKAKDLNNGYYTLYAKDGSKAHFSKNQIRRVLR
ncbi:hypothetical protein EVJ32_04780 [Exiguobacterium sp. SH5S4]|uniref:hypothetical protein n=1 Tax=Exiguobacterium sp. SH5S4 TaxID=2510961 RepID=UPI00103DA982|nr:hypothetical protein [Exiguobacterium sp. SH5S4]TCI26692.1 hypothetical protein EVJ32_04780 [Exiguobacterium sp. SH5S4]